MNKIIVERPRRGGYGGEDPRYLSDQRRMDLEDLPQRESMRRRWGSNCKELNENLAPLRRFVESRVGLPWDDVYSEIRENLDASDATQYHILQHLEGYVEKNTFLDGVGAVCTIGYLGQPYVIGSNRYAGREMYVHPGTGILCITPARARRTRERNDDRVLGPKGSMEQYHRLHGVWYVLSLEKLPADALLSEKKAVLSYRAADSSKMQSTLMVVPTRLGRTRDVLLRESLYDLRGHRARRNHAYGRDDVYASRGRMMNKKQLRKAGLRNVPGAEAGKLEFKY